MMSPCCLTSSSGSVCVKITVQKTSSRHCGCFSYWYIISRKGTVRPFSMLSLFTLHAPYTAHNKIWSKWRLYSKVVCS